MDPAVDGGTVELFRVSSNSLTLIPRTSLGLEREIQRLLEANLETVFGVRFVASEYSTGEKHAGRIDSLGMDENGTPVIVEYKLSTGETVINQALYYMDWLMDHKGDFEMLVQKRLGSGVVIDWTAPRVLCVAESFSKYDTYAVGQMGRNIQLVQYKVFGNDLLLVDVVGGGKTEAAKSARKTASPSEVASYSVEMHLEKALGDLRSVADELRQYLLDLGEDVTEGPVKNYIAYRTTRNFCCLEIHQKHLFLYLSLDPIAARDCSFCRDVRSIGHFGTGSLELRVTSADQAPEAKRLIDLAYERSGD